MKSVAGTIIVLAVLLAGGCSSGGGDPLQFEAYRITTGEEITGIDFLSGSVGCAITARGNIYRTDDGGKTFTMVGTSNGKRLVDINFLDGEIGLACGDKGALLRTTDGGSNWVSVTADSVWNLASIGFPGDELGIIAGNFNTGEMTGAGVIGRSTDEGASWRFSTTTYKQLRQVDFVPTQNVWILGDESLVYTTDGGQAWDQVASRTAGISALLFVDVQHGWEVGDSGLIRYSSDGGWSWQNKLKMTDEPLTCIAVPEPDRVYVAGNNFIAVSTNHGRNWIMDSISHQIRFVEMDAVGHDVFVAGKTGELIKLKK